MPAAQLADRLPDLHCRMLAPVVPAKVVAVGPNAVGFDAMRCKRFTQVEGLARV